MTDTVLAGGTLLLPDGAAEQAALVLSGARIKEVIHDAHYPQGARVIDVSGHTVAPGFVDIQVNGGGGVLFNDAPTIETIETIIKAHRPFGTTSLLPTLISDTEDQLDRAVEAVTRGLERRIEGLLGLHLEGPHLNKSKRGIHCSEHFTPFAKGRLERAASALSGPLLVTIAPELADPEDIAALAALGVIVSAGHSAADYDQTQTAIDAGVSGFTHLFNAMPQMTSRDPGIIAAAIESNAWCSIIADGHHVHEAMLRLALRAKRDGRMILVTDAMASIGSNASEFFLGGTKITVRDGRCVDENGTLAGAHLTMIDAVRYAVNKLGCDLPRAVAMATSEPASFLGVEREYGNLIPGAQADLVVLTPELDIAATVKAGNLQGLT